MLATQVCITSRFLININGHFCSIIKHSKTAYVKIMCKTKIQLRKPGKNAVYFTQEHYNIFTTVDIYYNQLLIIRNN